jgi:hypothetical protein
MVPQHEVVQQRGLLLYTLRRQLEAQLAPASGHSRDLQFVHVRNVFVRGSAHLAGDARDFSTCREKRVHNQL